MKNHIELTGRVAFAGVLLFAVATGCGQIPQDDEPPPATAANPPPAPDVQVAANADEYADTDPSALTDFRATLDPHGAWVEDPNYGTVWVPNAAEVGPDFTPYDTAGHWAYDDADYVWVSDYDWGWAPFHYGRWVMGYGGGWVWIPGRVYGPAWVSWRMGGGDYIGWGVAPPLFVWRGGYPTAYVGVGYGYGPRYSFVAHGDIFSPHVHGSVVVGAQAGAIAVHSTAYGAGGSVRGPAPASIGVSAGAVVHVSANDRGMTMARGFSKPSTAVALGAHAPSKHVVRGAQPRRAAGPAVRRGGAAVHSGGGGRGGHR
jgi:hypothetical protein